VEEAGKSVEGNEERDSLEENGSTHITQNCLPKEAIETEKREKGL
jgi:hypothetical protein